MQAGKLYCFIKWETFPVTLSPAASVCYAAFGICGQISNRKRHSSNGSLDSASVSTITILHKNFFGAHYQSTNPNVPHAHMRGHRRTARNRCHRRAVTLAFCSHILTMPPPSPSSSSHHITRMTSVRRGSRWWKRCLSHPCFIYIVVQNLFFWPAQPRLLLVFVCSSLIFVCIHDEMQTKASHTLVCAGQE